MFKKLAPVFVLALLAAGCATTLTNLTPVTQQPTANNLYPVEVAVSSAPSGIQWDTVTPEIIVGDQAYPMTPSTLTSNRWAGYVPVPKGADQARYRYKFNYEYRSLGQTKANSVLSPEYLLQVK